MPGIKRDGAEKPKISGKKTQFASEGGEDGVHGNNWDQRDVEREGEKEVLSRDFPICLF